jgi:hypothetical protein
MITESDIKTKDAVAVVLRRSVRWLRGAVKRWAWVVWACGILSVAGWHAWQWQWWVAYVPLVLLVEIAHAK